MRRCKIVRARIARLCLRRCCASIEIGRISSLLRLVIWCCSVVVVAVAGSLCTVHRKTAVDGGIYFEHVYVFNVYIRSLVFCISHTRHIRCVIRVLFLFIR